MSRTTQLLPRIAWPLIILTTVLLVVFGVIRSLDMFSTEAANDVFESRYQTHPIMSLVHLATGLLFLAFAPLQFWKKFRQRHLQLHRIMGRTLIGLALVSGVYAMALVIYLPVFGGIAAASASWFFGLLFLFGVGRGFYCARKRQIQQHREWMIRTMAIGLGVGVQRIYLMIMMTLGGHSFYDLFGPMLWLGFGTSLVLAEIWINLSRARR